MPPTLAVIIVNYNAGDHLARCLASLPGALAAFDWEAIVFDNASVDGSPDVVSQAVDPGASARVRLVRSPTNLGFGNAVNRAATDTRAPWLLLLNPDAVLEAGVCERLIEEFGRHPSTAVIGPGIRNDDGSVQGSARGDPSFATALFGRTSPLTRWFPASPLARRSVVPPHLPAGQTSLQVDWVSGACMLLRRDAFDRVGGFDPAYFLYWEDADLCRRLRLEGFSVRYQPDTWVSHVVGGSSRTAPALAVRAFYDGALRYYTRYVARNAPQRWALALYLRALAGWKVRRAERSRARSV